MSGINQDISKLIIGLKCILEKLELPRRLRESGFDLEG